MLLAHGLQQGPRFQERLGEEQVAHAVKLVHGFFHGVGVVQLDADPVLQDLRVEQLLAVLPFVQSLALIQALVALHADQGQAGQGGGADGQFGLADAGRALDQQGLAEVRAHEQGGGDAARGDIADVGKAIEDAFNSGEGLHQRIRRRRGGCKVQRSQTFEMAGAENRP